MDTRAYEKISEWLQTRKDCISNSYLKGTFTHKKLTPSINDEFYPLEADLLGIRYEFVPQKTVSIDFYGYIVQLCQDEKQVSCAIGEILRLKEFPPHFGFKFVEFHIAFEFDTLKDDIRNACDYLGVGVLRLREREGREVIVEEMRFAKRVEWQGMPYSDQRSYGIFQDAIRRTSYLNDFLRSSPDKFFNDFIRQRFQ